MLGISPQKNKSYVFVAKLLKPGTLTYRVDPSIDTGADFKISYWDYSTDFTAFVENSDTEFNLSTIKKLSATGSTIIISLTAAQMNHDIVIVTAVDADGLLNNWTNNCWVIYPDSRVTQFAHLDTDVSTASTVDLTTLEAAASAIQGVTDLLPDAGALTSIAPAAVADAVWDEALLDHTGTGSTGAAVTTSLSNDATSANQDAVIAAIGGLNNFDPALDTVANVTTVATNADMRGTDNASLVEPDNASIGLIKTETDKIQTIDTNVASVLVDSGATLPAQISALNDFNPTTDTVAHVTLADTVTTNTDMRGTDGANTATPPTVSQIWDELLSLHTGAGSAGNALATASSGGVDASVLADAIWDEATSGHITPGTTGEALTASGGGDATAANQDIIKSYLDTEISAIKAVTDNLPNSGTLSSIAQEATVTALNDISVADLLAGAIEGSLTLQQVLKVMLAVMAGQSTGGGTTTITMKDQTGTGDRVVATVDPSGNRSAVTLTV